MIYKRKIFDRIIPYLETDNIIVLHGARQVGKTHILYSIRDMLTAKSFKTHYIDLEDRRYLGILNTGVDAFILSLKEQGIYDAHKMYVLIDEIQYLDDPSNFLKLIADHHKNIHLIVSGSSSFEIKSKFRDSLVGRTVNFEVYPLDFEEFLLFKGKQIDMTYRSVFTSGMNEDLVTLFREYIAHGGYPKVVMADALQIKETYLNQIIDTYLKKDIRDIGRITDITKFNTLLQILASQSGNLLNITELANTANLHKKTVEDYIFLLENTYIIKIIRPFSGNLRFELTKMPKVYFLDTGLMHLLWLKTLPREILGNSFETSIIIEAIKRPSKSIHFWRTQDKKEIDLLLESIPYEMKLSYDGKSINALRYFYDKYGKTGSVITLKKSNHPSHPQYFPWEISSRTPLGG